MYYSPSLEYDAEADVLYINFGSTELSISEEINEDLVIDVGLRTGIMTGMRIISPLKRGIIFTQPKQIEASREYIPIAPWYSKLLERPAHS